ncbi:hypothetical protein BJY01DRAFT_251988 [Aspergillus pseudoustus]|uniref:Fumarylacetoacetase-like C-terminal domain-containing protein n=1 Tax=Aspergillus pseudoustus TaxID=1810923 RepID=A0ABR4J8N8_9EURO
MSARDISAQEAPRYILGYTAANDISARAAQMETEATGAEIAAERNSDDQGFDSNPYILRNLGKGWVAQTGETKCKNQVASSALLPIANYRLLDGVDDNVRKSSIFSGYTRRDSRLGWTHLTQVLPINGIY